jgi:hypothetical protein
MAEIPQWHVAGDWFDNCSCAVPCPCTFAQAPDNGFCESVLFWHVRDGDYGDVKLDNLSFVRVGRWEGDLWARKATGVAGLYIDDPARRASSSIIALSMILVLSDQLIPPLGHAAFCPLQEPGSMVRSRNYEEESIFCKAIIANVWRRS